MANWKLTETELAEKLAGMAKKIYVQYVQDESADLEEAAMLTQASAYLNFHGTQREAVEKDDRLCCPTCSAALDPDWLYCPKCATPIK